MIASPDQRRHIGYSSRAEPGPFSPAGGSGAPPRSPSSVERVRATLRGSPGLVPVAGTLPVVLWMVAHGGGFDSTTWYPVGLWLVLLLAILLIALPAARRPPPGVVAAVALLAAYAAWSYASIGWAEQKGMALEGANRTAFYAVVLALLALWPLRARAAAWPLGALAVGIAVVGGVELLRAASDANPLAWFLTSRFARPVGYVNGNVELWTAAFWPCAVLGARREVAPLLRALLVAAAVLLAGLSLIGQSRGWLFSLPVVAVFYVAFARERVRAVLWLLLPALAAAATAPAAFHLYDSVRDGGSVGVALRRVSGDLFVAAAVAGLIAFLGAAADRRVAVPRRSGRLAERALVAVALGAAAVAVILALAGVGHVGGRVDHAWHSFKRGAEPDTRHTRFGIALGSNRYDFWRVALGEFRRHPVAGIGADNFQQVYARKRRSLEEPLYPHSLPVRVLSQTGIVGAALFLAMLAVALAAAWVAVRSRRGIGAAVAVAGAVSFVYWIVHASVDWLWEFAGLGAVAFSMLGIAMALRPRRVARPGRARAPLVGLAAAAPVAIAALGLCVAFGAPWLAERYQQRAASEWRASSVSAYRDLDRAASLNPLSADPKLMAGAIALRLHDRGTARRAFSQALGRNGSDPYPLLELGMIEADAGRRPQARALLARAVRANPRDDLTRSVRARVARGESVNIASVNRTILVRSQKRLNPR